MFVHLFLPLPFVFLLVCGASSASGVFSSTSMFAVSMFFVCLDFAFGFALGLGLGFAFFFLGWNLL